MSGASFGLPCGRVIGGDSNCLIIAEIGQNHQGDISIAKQLIDTAKQCGADCVKFQKSSLPDKFSRSALARPYAGPHSWGATYGEHKTHLEFSCDQFRELQAHARQAGILFTASAMDPVSALFLHQLDVPFLKVGSGDADNLAMIGEMAARQRPLVISTGMQCLSTVQRAYDLVVGSATPLALLQCTSAYPAPPAEVHLRVLQQYRALFPRAVVGYSGHEVGTAVSVAAVALGAKVVERHLTLDRHWRGSDHASSLEPAELASMVADIRRVELALGTPAKTPQPSERACWLKLGKTVVAGQRLPAGHTLQPHHLKVKVAEPKGWPPDRINELVGRRLWRSLEEDQSVREEDLLPPDTAGPEKAHRPGETGDSTEQRDSSRPNCVKRRIISDSEAAGGGQCDPVSRDGYIVMTEGLEPGDGGVEPAGSRGVPGGSSRGD